MNLLSSILAYTARQIAALRSADTATNERIDATNQAASALTSRVSTNESNIQTMNNRLDTAISGVTTDTEVTDIRAGADGVNYTTAGLSVRTQFTNLKSDLGSYSLEVGYRSVNGDYVGSVVSSDDTRTAQLNVLSGEIVNIKGTGWAGAARLWATADASGKIIRRADPNASGELSITIADGEAIFVFNAKYQGDFYCKQEGVVTLSGKVIEELHEHEASIEKNADDIVANKLAINNNAINLNKGQVPFISAYSQSQSTTNYIAVVFPSSYFYNNKANEIIFNCYCEEDVTIYYMVYDVDLSQTGNNRLTTRLIGQTYANTKDGHWYSYVNDDAPFVSPSGDYVALVFNLVPTDGIKRIIKGYFRNITINGNLVDNAINQVFLYSASATADDVVGLYDTNVVSFINLLHEAGVPKISNGKILCIGDSLTAGVYASDETVHSENYPFYMKQLVSNDSVNKGMPGYSARMYWNNSVLSTSDFTDVKHIVIMLGTNGGLTDTLDADVLAYDDYTDYADTQTGCYCKIVEYCMEQAPTAQIYLCTTPYHNPDLQPNFDPPYTPNANIVIPKIAELYHFSMIDVRNGMGINQKNTLRFQSDGLHGDSEFYQKLGTFIGSQLRAKASYII